MSTNEYAPPCNANDDSGVKSFALPGGATTASDEAVFVPTMILQYTGPNTGAAVLSASLRDVLTFIRPVHWVIDMLHSWAGQSPIMDLVKERRVYIGASIMDVPVTIPFRVSILNMDGQAGFNFDAGWKIQSQGSVSGPVMREMSSRMQVAVAALGFSPVGVAVGNQLIFPMGSELAGGLVLPTKAGFGWRPNTLVVGKSTVTDDITVYIATGGLAPAIPTFYPVRIAPGVAFETLVVDPSWSGGVIIGNNLAGVTGRISLLWSKQ